MSPVTIYFSNETVPQTGSYRTTDVDHVTQQLNQGTLFPPCPTCGNPVGWIRV